MWYIMSYNQINGYFTGAFQGLHGLFYAGEDNEGSGENGWTNFISDATTFESHKEAKDYALSRWGDFMAATFMYVEYCPDRYSKEMDDLGRENWDKRLNFAKLVASNQVSKESLTEMAEMPTRHGMSMRESWIVKILNGRR